MSRTSHRFPSGLDRRTALLSVLMAAFSVQLFAAPQNKAAGTCDAPQVAGICDPYVPGTIGSSVSKKGFVVFTTWPGGPAEKAGICAGDTIVAIDGISASTLSDDGILKQMVSSTPGPVALTVKRGKELKGFRLYRAKESTLIRLSKQRYSQFVGFGSWLMMVPEDESNDEVKALEAYEKQLAAHNGFKVVDGFWPVPKATPGKAIDELRELWSMTGRRIPAMNARMGGFRYSTGAYLMVLRDPEQVLVSIVVPNSPAYHAGLLPGDTVLEIDGDALSGLGLDQLKALFKKLDAPRLITVKAKRSDSETTLEIMPEDAQKVTQSDPTSELPLSSGRPANNAYFVGANVLFDATDGRGMVSRVDYPSSAFDAGLHPGDLILSMNGTPTHRFTRAKISSLLSTEGPSPITFHVKRLGKRMTFKVVPTTHAEALAKVGRKMTKSGPAAQGCPG